MRLSNNGIKCKILGNISDMDKLDQVLLVV